jgi:hypothetical protein
LASPSSACPSSPARRPPTAPKRVNFCDLGRFLLLDRVGGNAETWFLARALRLLRLNGATQAPADQAQLVIAYSDPMPRSDCAGTIRFAASAGIDALQQTDSLRQHRRPNAATAGWT